MLVHVLRVRNAELRKKRSTEVFKDLATEFVERKSHDSSSLTNQRLVITSCHACELSTVDRLADSVISRQCL